VDPSGFEPEPSLSYKIIVFNSTHQVDCIGFEPIAALLDLDMTPVRQPKILRRICSVDGIYLRRMNHQLRLCLKQIKDM
jgi:hypothetical protein